MSRNKPLKDQLLIDRCQNGDLKAFDMLVRKYQQKVAYVVSKYTNNAQEVEDMTQEVFIKAFRAINQFKGNSEFYTWLYTIATNVSKNQLAYNSRRISFVDNVHDTNNGDDLSLLDLLEDDEHKPDERYETDELKQSLLDCIESMQSEAKEAFFLYEFKSKSYEEIAKIMDCPVGTIRSRIFRAREIIDKHLKEYLS